MHCAQPASLLLKGMKAGVGMVQGRQETGNYRMVPTAQVKVKMEFKSQEKTCPKLGCKETS